MVEQIMRVKFFWPTTTARERRFPTPVFIGNVQVDPNVVARVDTSDGPVTVTLPPAFNSRGVSIAVKDVGGQAGTSNITIAPSGGDTIDGGASQVVAVNRGSRTLTSDGVSDWIITATYP